MNSETIKGRLSQHVKRRIQSQESIECKNSPHLPPNLAPVIAVQPIIKEEEVENTSIKSVKKRKMTKKSSTQSVDSNADDDDKDKCDKRSDKNNDTGLDILTLILNYKKSEFLRNPEINELLNDINKKKSSSLSELIQS